MSHAQVILDAVRLTLTIMPRCWWLTSCSVSREQHAQKNWDIKNRGRRERERERERERGREGEGGTERDRERQRQDRYSGTHRHKCRFHHQTWPQLRGLRYNTHNRQITDGPLAVDTDIRKAQGE